MIVTKTQTLKDLLIIICVLIIAQGHCQIPYPEGIGTSMANNRNINHPDGTQLQDIKRSSGLLVDIGKLACSCNLINTTGNKPGVYLVSTNAHCVDDYSRGEVLNNLRFSFDFEVADALTRYPGTETISLIYEVESKLIVKDELRDIALLELTVNDDNIATFKNAFAAGWDNTIAKGAIWSNISHPKSDHKKVFIDPRDLKSGITGFSIDYSENPSEADYRPFQGYAYDTVWDKHVPNLILEPGTSGSANFSKENAIKALQFSGTKDTTKPEGNDKQYNYSTSSHISNTWYQPEDTEATNYLSKYLDPNNTYLNKIPGGYINDLVAINDDETFELTLTDENKSYSTPGINPDNPQELQNGVLYISSSDIFGYGFGFTIPAHGGEDNFVWQDILGIKAETITDNSDLVLAVYALLKRENDNTYEEVLIYGTHVNKDSETQEPTYFGFKGDPWKCADINDTDQQYPDTDQQYPSCTGLEYIHDTFLDFFGIQSDAIKPNILSAHQLKQVRTSEQQPGFFSIKFFETPIRIVLKNIGETSTSVKVQAVSYPGDVPKNALQLFKPEAVRNKFKSYKYHESRRESSENLFINQAIFQQGLYEKTVATGNNGGYINLINPHYKIGPIYTSTDEDEKSFNAYFHLNNGIENDVAIPNYSYKFWIDYFKERNTNDYSYNFVTDHPTTHDIELIKSKNDINKPVIKIIDNKMPSNEELGLKKGECRETRMRISVKQGGTLPEQDDTGGIGEVEDYLIEICAPTAKKIAQSTKNKAKVRISGANSPQNTPTPDSPGTPTIPTTCPTVFIVNPVPAPTPTPGETAAVEDVNEPTTCNTFIGDCVTAGDCFNLAIDTDKIEENYAINFKGNDNIIGIDNGDVLIHEAFEERTVSLWVKKDAITANDEVIYEEGGSGNGLAIRLHNGKVELAALIGGQFYDVKTSNNITLNQWVNITGVFNKGVISLYIDGGLVGTSNGFENSQVTQMPVHHDDAGWGGTNHSNVWNETLSSFDGLSDDLQIYAEALTDEQIALIATAPITSAARTATKKESGNNTEPERVAKTDNETPVEPPVFAIFPKPAKNHLNILLEVSQAGPLQLDIVDLSGKVVYQMQRPNIVKGHQIIQLRQLELPAAIYVLKLKAGNVTKQEKIVFE